MPHWACHYYRLETQSTFVVGSWAFSYVDSIVSLVIYTCLVAINLISIVATKYRIVAAALTGIGHISLGMLHAYRLVSPFTFEVFGYHWSYGASLREALIVIPFGLFSMFVAFSQRMKGPAGLSDNNLAPR
jgi:hypothetical protein